jgi:hypothetical protein
VAYYSKENIEIASYDATDNYTGNTLTTTFTGNEALYSVVENLERQEHLALVFLLVTK